jgi:hypothetical protein
LRKSSGEEVPRVRLQLAHDRTRLLSRFDPPADFGMMWSSVDFSKVSIAEHQKQVPKSR